MVAKKKPNNSHKRVGARGSGLINKVIDKLPFEIHLPSYQFCGPGTKLEKRLERGDSGVNKLDRACKEHDIAYTQFNDLENRHKADQVLIEKAVERLKSKDASAGERLAALIVISIMKSKVKLGMGAPKRKRATLKNLKVAKRIIKTPKRGGFLPLLIPLLGALGALGGGAAGIAKAVNDAKAAKLALEESKRHNKAMETSGKGLKKKKNKKKGRGLYIGPYQWYQKNYQ